MRVPPDVDPNWSGAQKRARNGAPATATGRGIDFRRWGKAVISRPWFVIGGLLIGLVAGGLYSTSSSDAYSATVTLEPAQPFNPSGTAILQYSSSPLAIQTLVNSAAGLALAAKAAHVPLSELEGHVKIGSVYTGTGAVASRGTVLIQITATLPQKQQAAAAANELGVYIKNQTEGPYVRHQLGYYNLLERSYVHRLAAVNSLISSYQQVLGKAKLLDPVDKITIAAELNNEISTQGALENLQLSTQNSATLAQNIEVAQIVNYATGAKAAPPSRRNSILFGGLIGLLIGVIVALVVGLRSDRPRAGAAAAA